MYNGWNWQTKTEIIHSTFGHIQEACQCHVTGSSSWLWTKSTSLRRWSNHPPPLTHISHSNLNHLKSRYEAKTWQTSSMKKESAAQNKVNQDVRLKADTASRLRNLQPLDSWHNDIGVKPHWQQVWGEILSTHRTSTIKSHLQEGNPNNAHNNHS